MGSESVNLLRMLGSGVRPAGGAGATAPVGGIAEGQFAELLSRAQNGELASNRAVTIASDAGVRLSADQLARISLAADKAEVAGIRTAAVLIDGKAVVLDVGNRTITGSADLSSGVVAGVDGIINLMDGLVNPGADSGAGAVSPGFPRLSGAGESLARLLAEREAAGAAKPGDSTAAA